MHSFREKAVRIKRKTTKIKFSKVGGTKTFNNCRALFIDDFVLIVVYFNKATILVRCSMDVYIVFTR